jgi:LysM repeat protein
LQERVRGIPAELSLLVGLDSSLGRDIDQARQALQALRRIQPVPLQQGEVQFILGRAANGSTGLFYPGMDAVSGSFGAAGEAIAAAITRLQPRFKSLLATRIVKLTLNSTSSRLNVAVAIAAMGQNQVIASTLTSRAASVTKAQPASGSNRNSRKLPIGTAVELRLSNQESRDLYFSVLVIDATGEMSVIFPNQWTASAEVMQVKAGQTLNIPQAGDPFKLVTQAPTGMTEVLIIASSSPLENALKALQSIAARGGQTRGFVALSEPADIIASLLDDLSRGQQTRGDRSTTTRTIDTSQTAALSLSFEVV